MRGSQEIYFIVNEGARTGKAAGVWGKVRELLTAKEVTYKAYQTKYKGHATKLAQKISSLPQDVIYLIVLGGDGTVNEVLNGITDFDKVRLGVIPTGSGNDFGRGLGIPKDAGQALEQILLCIERECSEGIEPVCIDLGEVSWSGCDKSRIFGISAGVGLDAIVCKKALQSGLKKFLNKLHLGKLTYLILTVETLFSMDTASLHFTYYQEQEKKTVEEDKVIFAAVMNLRAEGGGVPMAPHASCIDGKLSVCSAYGIPKWRTFFCLPFLVAARHEHIRGFCMENAQQLELTISKPMVLHADGEYLGDVTQAQFRCLRGRLRLLRESLI